MKIHYVTSFMSTLKLPIMACWMYHGYKYDFSENPDDVTCGNCKRSKVWLKENPK